MRPGLGSKTRAHMWPAVSEWQVLGSGPPNGAPTHRTTRGPCVQMALEISWWPGTLLVPWAQAWALLAQGFGGFYSLKGALNRSRQKARPIPLNALAIGRE